MADLIPSSSSDSDDGREDRDPRVIGLDSDEADDLLGAISSSTARSVLTSLHEAPATPSDLATEVDTSLQNVQYHLGNLSEAGLIEVTDTRYSEKGREMNVYTPSDRALVVVAGREDETRGLKGALTRLIGGVGVLGIGAAVVNRLARTGTLSPFATAGSSASGDGGGAAGGAANESTASDVSVSYTGDGGSVNTTGAEQTRTVTQTATETAGDGDGFTIAEATTTESAETTAEATRTVTEAATQTPASTPLPTEEPTATAVQTATETVAQAASGSPGLADTIGSLSPGTLFFLGGMTVLVAWVAVGLLRD